MLCLLVYKPLQIRQLSVKLLLEFIAKRRIVVHYFLTGCCGSLILLRFALALIGSACRIFLRDRHCGLLRFVLLNLVVGQVLVEHVCNCFDQLKYPLELAFVHHIGRLEALVNIGLLLVVFPGLVSCAHHFILRVGVGQALVLEVVLGEVLNKALSARLA